MNYDFKVGDKVVCVDDGDGKRYQKPSHNYDGGLDGLTRDSVYTIRAICDHPDGSSGCLKLQEIVRAPVGRCFDAPYSRLRFRPLVKTSISVFRAIAQGVTDGKPVVEDQEYRLPTPEKVKA